MSTNESSPRAFGGGPLHGDNWVRIAYLDESGTGSLHKDPILTVAGVIVDADAQIVGLESRLYDILHRSVPLGLRVPRYLHAKDIYHGTHDYHYLHWPEQRRTEILRALALLPIVHNAAVVYGSVDRVLLQKENPDAKQKDLDQIAYTQAATLCMMQIEKFMRTRAGANEICSVTFENGARGVARVKEVHRAMKYPDKGSYSAEIMEFLPITKIRDAPNFQEKNDSSILQLADFCAFALKRRDSNGEGWQELCADLLKSCFGTWSPKRG